MWSVWWLSRGPDIKPTIGQESLHQDSNDNGVRLVNLATSKNLVVKSTMFPHRNIHKYTWTSPDGETHNQIDHVLIDRGWHSSVLDVRSFRGADCDTDHYLAIANVRERLAVGKQAAQRFHWQRFNLRKPNEPESMWWVPVTTAWRVLRLRIEERRPIRRVAANKLNKQSRTADEGWSSSLGVGRGVKNPSLLKPMFSNTHMRDDSSGHKTIRR